MTPCAPIEAAFGAVAVALNGPQTSPFAREEIGAACVELRRAVEAELEGLKGLVADQTRIIATLRPLEPAAAAPGVFEEGVTMMDGAAAVDDGGPDPTEDYLLAVLQARDALRARGVRSVHGIAIDRALEMAQMVAKMGPGPVYGAVLLAAAHAAEQAQRAHDLRLALERTVGGEARHRQQLKYGRGPAATWERCGAHPDCIQTQRHLGLRR